MSGRANCAVKLAIGMMRLSLFGTVVAAVLMGVPTFASASSSTVLDSLRAIHSLTNSQADNAIPVAFEASVTYYRKGNVDLFVQDGDAAIYVEAPSNGDYTTGDRVLVRGVTRGSFRPEIKGRQVTFLHHGLPPPPMPATFKQLIRADFDCRRVTIRAVVRGGSTVLDVGARSTYLQLLMDGGEVDAEVFGSESSRLSDLLDSEVEITGAVAGKFDSKMQMTGILLEVPSLSDLRVIRPALHAPASLPITPMDDILKALDVQDRTQRVRVEGTVTYYQPGSAVVLQDGYKSLWIMTEYEEPIRVGEMASASGFPEVNNGFLTLTRGEIDSSGVLAPVAPRAVGADELAKGSHATELVSVQGRLLMSIREAARDEYVIVSGNHLFSAVYRHPGRGLEAIRPPLKQVAAGATVRVTGICTLDRGDLYQGPVPFEILMRSPDDIDKVADPPWLSVRHLTGLVGALLLVVFATGIRAWVIERRQRNRIAQMMRVERIRSHILEQINRARPLKDVLEQITQLVLLGVPATHCWCMLETGEEIGKRPPESPGGRLVRKSISARSGPPYGTLWAEFPEGTAPGSGEAATLSTAAELATVAIETSRTHSDLIMRSEFDLLTGLHNRFALERSLEALTERRLAHAGIQALIYMDLDDFKQVNDQHGHHMGDLYLREIALRMKNQVRPTDLLARLGGDEFAVVVSGARSRSDVEEIADRLQHCFDLPFELDGLRLIGSASFGIAYCPENGTTKDALLKSADISMYEGKRAKREKTVRGR